MADTKQDQLARGERRKSSNTDAYFNAQFGAEPLYIEPGEFDNSASPEEMIVATIGSGVGVSIYDKGLHVGGLAYVLMPDDMIKTFPHFDSCDPQLIRAVTKPIENCIGAMKRAGAGKNRIRIRLTGGTTLPGDELDRGTKNYIFVKEYLTRKGLVIMSEDLAGPYIRRVHFFPATGRSVRRTLRRMSDYKEMQEKEQAFHNKHSVTAGE